VRVYNSSSGPTHRLVGGMRASIYGAMPIQEGVRALIEFMQSFERRHG